MRLETAQFTERTVEFFQDLIAVTICFVTLARPRLCLTQAGT